MNEPASPAVAGRSMNVFERCLSVWVVLCIVAGIALGRSFPGVFRSIAALEVARVNLPVGLLIWVMIIPMLMRVDFNSLHEIRGQGRGIAITLLVNWAIKLFTMAALGWLFIYQVFAPWLPADQLDTMWPASFCWAPHPAPPWCSCGATCVGATPTSRFRRSRSTIW